MSRYDGLIIPRSYSEYINKTDAATLSQALQLSGVLSGAVAAGDNKAVKSSAVNAALTEKIKLVLEKSVTLQKGANVINFNTNSAYLLIASGNNYGQGICFVSQGYSMGVIKGTILANNIDFGSNDYLAKNTITVTNNSSGNININIYSII